MLIEHVGSILLEELRKMNGDGGCPLSAGLWHHSVGQPRKVTLPQFLHPPPALLSGVLVWRPKGAIYWGKASWLNMDSSYMDSKGG